MLATFVQPGAWSLDVFRWKPALRIEQETAFLSRIVPFYDMARLVETHVPPDGRVLTFGTVAEAYTSREILIIYEAALNGIAGETLGAGASTAYHPQVVWDTSSRREKHGASGSFRRTPHQNRGMSTNCVRTRSGARSGVRLSLA